jgi:hypothetical protein
MGGCWRSQSEWIGGMNWEEVFKFHRSFKAVAKKGPVATSVLAGNQIYDFSESPDGGLRYLLPTSCGYSWMRRALDEARRRRSPIRVFRKVASNDWNDLGDWVIQRITITDQDSIYELRRSLQDERIVSTDHLVS